MIGSEWDMATALEVEREEGYEKGLERGLEKGRERGREEAAQNMLRKGFSYEQTAELSMLDIDKVRELYCTIQA
jgi:predicted transposase/invertase (TIGR01784 family)